MEACMQQQSIWRRVGATPHEHGGPVQSTLLWGAVMVLVSALIIAVLINIGAPTPYEGAIPP